MRTYLSGRFLATLLVFVIAAGCAVEDSPQPGEERSSASLEVMSAAPYDEVAKVHASDPEQYSSYGSAVGLSQGTLVVGAHRADAAGSNSGAAYVYERDQGGANQWGEVAKLVPSDLAAHNSFGWSAAIDGDVIVVGAFKQTVASTVGAGAAYVYERDGNGDWTEVARLTASDSSESAAFGRAVAVDGDVIVVGANQDQDRGAAYVFEKSNGAWSEVAKLQASDAEVNDNFGGAVDLDGDLVVVGALASDEATISLGSAYVFQRGAAGGTDFTEVDKLLADDGQDGGNLGMSVAISGDTIVAGAMNDYEGGIKSGAAYVYERSSASSTDWSQVKTLVPSDPVSNGRFGTSASLEGDELVIGAQYNDSNGNEAGAAYVFSRDAGGAGNWGQVEKLLASNGAADDDYGWSVAAGANEIAVGALQADGAQADIGGAYIYGSLQVPPVAEDDEATVDEDAEVTIDVLANDSDGNGDTLTLESVTQPANGTASVVSGQVEYVPEADFNGTDSFDYTVSDGSNTATATVTVTVEPINDAPTITNTPPSTATVGTEYRYDAQAEDVEDHALAWAVLSADTCGGTFSGAAYTFTPDAAGSCELAVEVCDDGTPSECDDLTATVTIEEGGGENSAPEFVSPTPEDGATLMVAAGDTLSFKLVAQDPDGDALTYGVAPMPAGANLDTTSGAFGWTPTVDDVGTLELTLTVSDGQADDTRDITVQIGQPDSDDDGIPDADDACPLEAGDGPDGCPTDGSDAAGEEDGCGCGSASGPGGASGALLFIFGLLAARSQSRSR
ncbi:MAG: Ig-like domain-containing protein [Myxococcota bacterium]